MSDIYQGSDVLLLKAPYSPQTIVIKAIADVATANLSAALTKPNVRLIPSVDSWFVFTNTDLVTAATGHMILAGQAWDFTRVPGTTKISIVAVGSTAGTLYLSELG